MLMLDTIMKDTLWVAKMNGWRKVGTYAELEDLSKSEECRDFDIVCLEGQPDHLKGFYKEYFEYCEKNEWMIIPEYYKDIYLVDHQNPTPAKEKRIWTEDEIKNLIQTNDNVLYAAFKKLYACQTADEQDTRDTHHVNGIGFNGVDAPILSSMAEFLIKTGFLTPKQKVLVRKKLIKYNKQLTKLANA